MMVTLIFTAFPFAKTCFTTSNSSVIQPITKPAHRMNLFAGLSEFFPETAQVCIYGAYVDVVIVSPDCLQK